MNHRVLHPKGLALGVEGIANKDGMEFFEVAVYDYGEPVTYDDESGTLGETVTLTEYSTKNRSTI